MTLGLDLSDGHARAVVVNEDAQVLARSEHPLAGTAAAAAAAALRSVLAALAGPVGGLAIAVPHPGEAVSPEVHAVVRELLPQASPPLVVAAGVAAVVGEQWCGAARDWSTVVALSVGEHVTSGILIEGRAWTGAHGHAGAVGWLSLNPVEREDYRRLGGLEAEVSSSGLVRRIVWRIKSGDHSIVVQQNQGDLARITAEQVFQGARAGDGLCVSVIRDTAKYLGMAVSNLAAILDPQAIVLGGLIATSGDVLLDPIRAECGRRLSHPQVERLQIVLSTLGPDAAAIGAARMAFARA